MPPTSYLPSLPARPAEPGTSKRSTFIRRLREYYGPGVLQGITRASGDKASIDVKLSTFQCVQLEFLQQKLLQAALDFQYLSTRPDDQINKIEKSLNTSLDYMNNYGELKLIASERLRTTCVATLILHYILTPYSFHSHGLEES